MRNFLEVLILGNILDIFFNCYFLVIILNNATPNPDIFNRVIGMNETISKLKLYYGR